jgi:hypothetical protein
MGVFVLRVKPLKSLDCFTLNLKALGQEILNQGHGVTSLKTSAFVFESFECDITFIL